MKFNDLTERIEAAGYPVLDFNQHIDEIGLDFSTDFYDYGGHVTPSAKESARSFCDSIWTVITSCRTDAACRATKAGTAPGSCISRSKARQRQAAGRISKKKTGHRRSQTERKEAVPMCGIAGFCNRQKTWREDMERMKEQLISRGPDAEAAGVTTVRT